MKFEIVLSVAKRWQQNTARLVVCQPLLLDTERRIQNFVLLSLSISPGNMVTLIHKYWAPMEFGAWP